MNLSLKKYLLWFAQEHIDFRLMEIQSIIEIYRISVKWLEQSREKPYWIGEFKTETDIRNLCSRSVSLRCVIELWSEGKTLDELHKHLQMFIKTNQQLDYFNNANLTFKVNVETFNNHISQKEKVDKIEYFNYMPLKGEVKLKNPDFRLDYIEYYGLEANNVPQLPFNRFFGRWICDGSRDLIKKLSLKTRKFIGNTSMDPQLSLLMANHAKVRETDLVFDPFVGSGSLLVAAAQFGAYVFGTDIDYLMLHAKTKPTRINQKIREKDESILSNLKMYKLENRYLDVIVSDFSLPIWRSDIKFNAIITDPPYGMREATERIGTERENKEVSEEHLSTHIPSKVNYDFIKLYKDLLEFSVKHLLINGRLVCWFPVFRDDYNDQLKEDVEPCLPSHSCLVLVNNSEQVLSKHTSRRLLVYEKIMEMSEVVDEVNCKNQFLNFRKKFFSRDGLQTRKETRLEKYNKS